MPRGGPRPGFGGKQPGAGRPRKVQAPANLPPRPAFTCAREFGLWALNASDAEVSMPQKLKAMAALLAQEAKRPDGAEKPPAVLEPAGGRGIYTPRGTPSFEVVEGARAD